MTIMDLARRIDSPSPVRLHAPFVRLSGLVVVLLVLAAGSGLVLHPYAGETDFARNGYRGADLVSLTVVLPLLVWATVAARRGSGRGLLLWLGAIGYVAYQYGYTFAYRWNRLFLVYLALLVLSAFSFAAALISLNPRPLAGRFDRLTPTGVVSRFLLFVGVALGVMELAQIVPTIFTGGTPQIVTDTGHPTSPVYVLDLGLVVPAMVLAGIWLRQRRPWGFIAAAVLLVKGATVGLGLLAGNLFAVLGDDKNDGPLVVLWAAIALGSAAVLWLFLRHLRDDVPPAVTHSDVP
ncbi:MAG: hypothetical protein ACLGI2_17000 [Acidimicrobiia bacterium]